MHSVQTERPTRIPSSVGKAFIVPIRDFGARCIAVPNRVSAAVAAYERDQDEVILDHIRGVGQSAMLAFQAVQTLDRPPGDSENEPVTYEGLAGLLKVEANTCRQSAQWCLESLALRDDLDLASSELDAVELAWRERKKLRPRSSKNSKGKKRKTAALRADRDAAMERLLACQEAAANHLGGAENDPNLIGTSGERLLIGELCELADRADSIATTLLRTRKRATVVNLVEIPNSRVTARSLVPVPRVIPAAPIPPPRSNWLRRLIDA